MTGIMKSMSCPVDAPGPKHRPIGRSCVCRAVDKFRVVFCLSMTSLREKRVLGIAKDAENTLPVREDAKRSKCHSTSPEQARNENTPVEHVEFKTPKATR